MIKLFLKINRVYLVTYLLHGYSMQPEAIFQHKVNKDGRNKCKWWQGVCLIILVLSWVMMAAFHLLGTITQWHAINPFNICI